MRYMENLYSVPFYELVCLFPWQYKSLNLYVWCWEQMWTVVLGLLRRTVRRWRGSWRTPSADTGSKRSLQGARSEDRVTTIAAVAAGRNWRASGGHWSRRWRKAEGEGPGSHSRKCKEQKTQLERQNGTNRRMSRLESQYVFPVQWKEKASGGRETDGTSDWFFRGFTVESSDPPLTAEDPRHPFLKGLPRLKISWNFSFP